MTNLPNDPRSFDAQGSWRVAVAAMAAAAFLQCGTAYAQQPTGPSVVAGAASFATSGNRLTVTNSPNAIINWQSFSIGAGNTTRFEQQSSQSTVMNRVVEANPSVILGTLSSNGNVFLVNPNGIIFGAGSRVDVGGLLASTMNLSDSSFLSGNLQFTPSNLTGPTGIRLDGTITSSGDLRLVSSGDISQGGFVSSSGSAIYESGSITITASANVFANATITTASANNLADAGVLTLTASGGSNGALMIANGGSVNASGGIGATQGNGGVTLTSAGTAGASNVGFSGGAGVLTLTGSGGSNGALMIANGGSVNASGIGATQGNGGVTLTSAGTAGASNVGFSGGAGVLTVAGTSNTAPRFSILASGQSNASPPSASPRGPSIQPAVGRAAPDAAREQRSAFALAVSAPVTVSVSTQVTLNLSKRDASF